MVDFVLTNTVGFSLTCGYIGVTLLRVSEMIASGVMEDESMIENHAFEPLKIETSYLACILH